MLWPQQNEDSVGSRGVRGQKSLPGWGRGREPGPEERTRGEPSGSARRERSEWRWEEDGLGKEVRYLGAPGVDATGAAPKGPE